MNKEEIQNIRNKAITIFELTKGFVDEPIDKGMKSCLEMAGYVMELTNYCTREEIDVAPDLIIKNSLIKVGNPKESVNSICLSHQQYSYDVVVAIIKYAFENIKPDRGGISLSQEILEAHIGVLKEAIDTLNEKLILSSLPTHKEETKTLPAEILALDTAWPLIDVLKKLVHATDVLLHEKAYDRAGWEEIEHCFQRGKQTIELLDKYQSLSVPQPLKPLSDEEILSAFEKNLTDFSDYSTGMKNDLLNSVKDLCIKKITDNQISEAAEKHSKNYKHNSTDAQLRISQLDFIIGARWVRDNLSLPVDNTVSETETIDFWKIQNNSLQELITEKDLEIASLKEVVSEKSTFFHNQYKGILNEWEKCVSDRDMNIELLVKDVEILTSQLSLYNKADNILKDIVMCKSNEIGEDLTKRVVKILEDLQTLKQE